MKSTQNNSGSREQMQIIRILMAILLPLEIILLYMLRDYLRMGMIINIAIINISVLMLIRQSKPMYKHIYRSKTM
jgi:hypothetical protein